MMNLKQFIAITVLSLSAFVLSNCSDDNNLVGSGIIPDDNFITVYSDTFQIKASTIKLDSLYAKTTQGLLGEFYDPLYGHLKSDYLTEFYCKEGFEFYKTPYEGKIDSVALIIYYKYTGDPQASMQIQVYPVTKPLDKDYYTNINPEDYCDMQTPLGTGVYNLSNGRLDTTSQIYSLEIQLPVEFGEKIYNETINNPSSFANQTAFNQFFPGLYITTGYGSGSMLNLYQEGHTDLYITYKYALKDTAGKDSLVRTYERFPATKEVIQLNRVESYNEEQLLEENDEYTYLKTPAGIFTRLVIPAKEIGAIAKDRTLTNFTLNLKYMPQEDWMYALGPPEQLLLIPEDSVATYFKGNKKENNITTYLSLAGNGTSYTATYSSLGYNASNRTYYFNNIVNLLSYQLAKHPEEDLRLLVVPVKRNYSRYQSGYNSYTYSTNSLHHYLAPSGVKLRKDKESMKIVLTSSQYPE